ncbi:Mu transposase domain-containing protein [Streptomyces bicolor]|uniref:Mu transposase domain-containing protein n=1 Tax=Streptomyces bicolor TaxID=66874 RepID=UPI000690639D|nr:hypothetical protein [Streptomyces bicolor]
MVDVSSPELTAAQLIGAPEIGRPPTCRSSLRLQRDHYVRIDTNDCSVHPLAIGRCIEVKADRDQVLAFCEGTEVVRHARCWARHQSLTDPTHVAAAKPAANGPGNESLRPTSLRSNNGRWTPTTGSSASSTAASAPVRESPDGHQADLERPRRLLRTRLSHQGIEGATLRDAAARLA